MKIIRRIFGSLLTLLGLLYIGLIAYAYWPTGIEEVPARTLAGENDQFVIVEGLELRYQTFGTPGSGKPNLVLIHGFGNSLQSFRLLAPLLADDFYVVTFDMPGFGLSEKPVDYDYGNANQARMTSAFMKKIGIENPVIGGHSLGGAIALRVALNEPDVSGLLLINPGIINTGVPKITAYLPFPFQRLSAKQFGNREFRERFLKTSFINPDVVTEDVMDNLMLAPRSEGYMSGSTAMMGFYEEATEYLMLPDVEVPTIILWGALDRNKSPEELAQLEDGLKNDLTIQVETAGHYVHEEGAEESAAGLIANKSVWQ
ncbi:MAG: alpha/beta hydrolase [Gammaproteobacteria bacterium]|nr:alpha/beta hydrolase [Gammaproteobacteria bacterium]